MSDSIALGSGRATRSQKLPPSRQASTSFDPASREKETETDQIQRKLQELWEYINDHCIPKDHQLKNTPYPGQLKEYYTFISDSNDRKIDIKPLLGSYTTSVALSAHVKLLEYLVDDLHGHWDSSLEEIDRLSRQVEDQDKEIKRLRTQRNSATLSEADSHTDPSLIEILNRLSRRPSSKSAKLPNPEVFTGEPGKEPSFRKWKVDIKNKMEVNADHFPGDLAKVAYTFSRTSSQANTILRPYIDSGSPQVSTWNLVMELLSDTFDDPHYVENKKQQLRGLYQRNKPFAEFHSSFITLATNAGLAKSE